jgi:Zn-finger nucleic acid-binding protein
MVYRSSAASCRACRVTMTASAHQGVSHERCPRCASVWIHPHALNVLWQKMQPERALHFTPRTAAGRSLECPSCARPMAPAYLPFAVPIDWCQAHGVWFDTDELGPTLAAAYLDEELWWREFGKLVRSFT